MSSKLLFSLAVVVMVIGLSSCGQNRGTHWTLPSTEGPKAYQGPPAYKGTINTTTHTRR